MALLHTISRQNGFILDMDADRLEEVAADYVCSADCVLVERARDGLALALGACGVGDGDYVLCTPLGHSSLTGAIRRLGAKPMFVDINPNTFCMDPYCLDYVLRKRIREKGKMPKALIATDMFGLPCNHKALRDQCESHNIEMIVDMGASLGARIEGKRTGSLARFSVASFFESNAAGEWGGDGVVFCSNQQDSQLLRVMRGDAAVQEVLAGDWSQSEQDSDAQAILLEKKMGCYDEDARARRKIAGWYRERLKGKVRVQEPGEEYQSAYTQFAVALADSENRRAVISALAEERIPCTIYCPLPLHRRMDSDKWERVILANAEKVCQKLLLLPIHPYLSEHVVDYICAVVTGAVQTAHNTTPRDKSAIC